MATDGFTAVKLDLTNNNDAGKIWIEKPFQVQPNRVYQVNVSYSLASQDGAVGSFDIITGVLKQRPSTRNDLIPAFRETTDRGNSKPRYIWLNKHYEFAVSSAQANRFWIVIGVWGTFEVRHVYYIDSVRVEIAPKPERTEFYSFENDMDGWSANSVDVASVDWSIFRSSELSDDGAASLKIGLNNVSGKGRVWIEKPLPVEPGNKYRLSLDYAFSSSNAASFEIIAGVFRNRPETADDISSAFQGNLNRLSIWMHQSYEFTIKSKKSSTLHLVIGVLSAEQEYQEYYVDSVCVTLTKK